MREQFVPVLAGEMKLRLETGVGASDGDRETLSA